MKLSRRSFFKFMSAAPVTLALEEIFNPHRVIFDLGKNTIWMPASPAIVENVTLAQLNAITIKYFTPALADFVFNRPQRFGG